MAEIKFEIVRHLGVISESAKGWKKEVNMVAWNDRAPKLDIREWDSQHEKMGKGITLSTEEIKKLRDILCELELN